MERLKYPYQNRWTHKPKAVGQTSLYRDAVGMVGPEKVGAELYPESVEICGNYSPTIKIGCSQTWDFHGYTAILKFADPGHRSSHIRCIYQNEKMPPHGVKPHKKFFLFKKINPKLMTPKQTGAKYKLTE